MNFEKSEYEDLKVIPPNPKSMSDAMRFITELVITARRNNADISKTHFNYDGFAVLSSILFTALRNPKPIRLASLTLARMTGNEVTRRTVSNMIKSFCEWGFIHVDTTIWREKNGKFIRDHQIIELNPKLRFYFGDARAMDKRIILKDLVSFYLARVTASGMVATNTIFQGFREILVPYGLPDKLEHRFCDLDYCLETTEETEEKISKAAEKQKDAKIWRDRAVVFIDGASKIWIRGMVSRGHGKDKPVWSGSVASLTASGKRQRNELVKIFEEWGGAVTALAWTYYCVGNKETKADGSIEFDANRPHIQYASVDRKPEFFVKNFNALIKDPDFKLLAIDKWDDETKNFLAKNFTQEIIDVAPRDGIPYRDKIGFEFGEIQPPQLPTKTN